MRHHGRAVRGVDDLDGLLRRRTVPRHVCHRLRPDETLKGVLHARREALLHQDARDVRTRHDLPAGVALRLFHAHGHAERGELLHHFDVALDASRADAFEKRRKCGRAKVDSQPEHVELAVPLAGIHGKLDARKPQPGNAQRTARGEETRAAIRAVMVGERHHGEGSPAFRKLLRRTGSVRRRAVEVEIDHFFTISVIAWRNSLTSAKRR